MALSCLSIKRLFWATDSALNDGDDNVSVDSNDRRYDFARFNLARFYRPHIGFFLCRRRSASVDTNRQASIDMGQDGHDDNDDVDNDPTR